MTPLENEALNTLLELLEAITHRQISRGDFLIVMSHLRDTIKHLQALKAGCPTGTHFHKCTCKPAVKGINWNERYRRIPGIGNQAGIVPILLALLIGWAVMAGVIATEAAREYSAAHCGR